MKKDLSDQECLKFTLSKAVGLAIVAGSGILKLPQILKILASGSVEGISSVGYYLETDTFMQTAGMSMARGIPFSVYGETLIIMAQNFVIILMIWRYNKAIGLAEKAAVFLFFAGYGFCLFTNVFSPDHWNLISGSNTALTVFSKLPQIIQNFRMGSTGQMAFLTFLLNFLGSVARVGTVLMESDDFMFRLQYLAGLFLNFIIIVQFAMYWNVAKKVDASSTLDKNKSKKE